MEKGLRNIFIRLHNFLHTLFIIFSYCLCLFDAANVEQ